MISYVQLICEPNNVELTVMQHIALITSSLHTLNLSAFCRQPRSSHLLILSVFCCCGVVSRRWHTGTESYSSTHSYPWH